MFIQKAKLGLILAAVLAVSALTACAGDSSAGVPTKEQILNELPEQNLKLWTLPSESFDPPPSFLMDYAQDIVATSCWNENGLDIPVRIYNPLAPSSLTRSDSNYSLLSVDVAQKYGYQLDLDPRVDWGARKAYRNAIDALAEEQYAAFEDCATSAEKELGIDQVIMWGLSSPADIAFTPEMQAASDQWLECMSPLGIADLTSDVTPLMMPTPGALLMFGAESQDVPSWELIEPSDVEIKIAVQDAQCQADSNWRELYYQAAWDYEVQTIIDNYNYLSASRADNEKWEKQLDDVIASNGQ